MLSLNNTAFLHCLLRKSKPEDTLSKHCEDVVDLAASSFKNQMMAVTLAEGFSNAHKGTIPPCCTQRPTHNIMYTSARILTL